MAMVAFFFLTSIAHQALAIGVNYGRMGDNLPTPAQTVQLLLQHNITKVKLYDADPVVISAFANTGIELTVSAYNEVIWLLASDETQATNWFTSNILPHIPSTNITRILLGNEVLTRADPALAQALVPAMKNLHSAVTRLGLKMEVTTTHAMDVLDYSRSYPPSSGTFRTDLTVMKAILDFLADTNSSFVIDAYPYFAYRDDKGEHVELAYVLLDANSSKGADDWLSGIHYSNMLDAQVDTVYSAMAKLGHNGDVRIVVGETGWPSAGEAKNYGAGMENARAFAANLVARGNRGTPLQPAVPLETYLFALFNENLKTGSTAERNFGLFYPNMTQVYELIF